MAYFNQGTYECIILGQGFGKSKEKQTPFLFIRFQPCRLDGVDLPEGYERELKLYLTDGTIDRTIEQLRALGWEGTSFRELEPGGSHTFKGLNCRIRCMHEQSGEKVYEKWEFPYAGGQAATENESGLAKKLDGLFGAALKKSAGKPKVAKVEKEPTPQTVPASDDVPPDDEVPF